MTKFLQWPPILRSLRGGDTDNEEPVRGSRQLTNSVLLVHYRARMPKQLTGRLAEMGDSGMTNLFWTGMKDLRFLISAGLRDFGPHEPSMLVD